ncbi:MAG TPA: DUF2142 domain-containing protein [Candidatus Limnocylindrales bacterium]
MTDDLTQVPLDQPSPKSAPDSEPALDVRAPGNRLRGLGRPSALIGWLLVAIAGLGMFVSTPPSAGPDEPAHELTAWYLSGHGLRPTSPELFSVPLSFSGDPCFAHEADVTAGCLPPRSTAQVMVSTSGVLSYPPPYYWVVGLGERLATSLIGIEYADIGGRVASFILSFGALLLLSLYMRRRNQLWGTFLLLISTPLAVFMGAVVNPSGWEITCGIVMAAVLSEAVWSRQSLGSEAWPRTTTLILVVASVALSLARPLGFVWASGLTLSAIALAPSIHRRLLFRVACAVAPGIVLGLLWGLASRTGSPSLGGTVFGPTSVIAYPFWFAISLVLFLTRVQQMFGVLGWNDTSPPVLLILTNIFAWGVLFIRLPSIRRAAVLCGIFGIVILPAAIEASGAAIWPAWWQGRYTLPFALGFVLLLLLRSGQAVPRTASIVSSISLLSLGLMVWVNAIRYGFGLNAFGFPASIGNPGISSVRLGISATLGLLLLAVGAYLLVQAWRMKRELRLGQEPETLSTPA